MKNLFSENRLIYMTPGPEISAGRERLSQTEIQKMNSTLNKLVNKFDNLRKRHVKYELKRQLKTNLKTQVIDALKHKLDPYNSHNADSLFKVMYPPSKLQPILKKAEKKLRNINIPINSQALNNIKFGSKLKFTNLFTKECGVQENMQDNTSPEISMNGEKPWQNIISKIATNTTPSKIKSAFRRRKDIAIKAVQQTTQKEFNPIITSQIKKIIQEIT